MGWCKGKIKASCQRGISLGWQEQWAEIISKGKLIFYFPTFWREISIIFIPSLNVKVEKILKGSLDSIPSHPVKIQIMGGKVCLRCKGRRCRWVFKSGWASSNVVGIICHPGCNRINWTAHPLAASLKAKHWWALSTNLTMFCLITPSKLSHQ